MNLIDRAKILWKQRSRYAGQSELTLRDDATALAWAVQERLDTIDRKLAELQAASASRYDAE